MRWIRSRASEGAGGEEGSEVASTVLVQTLVVLVVLALVQLAFALHVRSLTVSAASEGARRGGLLGGDAAEAVARTNEVLATIVGGARDSEVTISYEEVGGRSVLVVTVRAPLPLLLGMGPRWMSVRGTSLVEEGADDGG